MSLFKKKITPPPSPDELPKHLGIIMDGNGRWAKKKGLPRQAGHSAGAANFKKLTLYCNRIGLKCLTVYAFSTENWKRPKGEIENLMNLFREYLKDALQNFRDENIVTRFVGDLSVLPDDIKSLIDEAVENTKDKTGMILNVAINYGGREEIVHAVKEIYKDIENKKLSIDDVTEDTITDNLYTKDYPEVDFIIRPSGEYRLSNFLMWQSAYSEFWYSDILWPDFNENELNKALADYAKRNRRFGGI
jgi:undecaprenyl diphosphate synthase